MQQQQKKSKLDYTPSHDMSSKFAILMETNSEESESWYYFIRYNGNEENLRHLNDQLKQVDWVIMDDLSTFDLELDYLVSAQTAKEMTKVDLNFGSYHRKFDGNLKRIDLDFKKKDGNSTKICKTFDVLGFGQIENFIDDEDLDEEDLISNDDDMDDDTDKEDLSDDEGDIPPPKKKQKMKLPPSLLNNLTLGK